MKRRRLIAVLATLACLPPLAQAACPSRAEAGRQAVQQAFDRWQRGEGNFFQDVLAEDVQWTIKGSGPSAGTYRGRQDFLDRAVTPFAARMPQPVRPTAVRVWADGDHVIAQWEGSGQAGDGQPYRNSYAWILRMQGTRAVEVTAFLDLAPYDDVLRRVPAPK